MERKKVTVPHLWQMKREGRKITKINLHDYPTAVLADQAGIDIVMTGDSIGMVVLGYENTIPVTMAEMIHHAKAVVRGAKHCLVVCDMPFMSYQTSVDEAVRNAGRILKETGVDAVKLEGGADIKEKVKAMVGAGIPVMGHIGLLPQRVSLVGKYRVQGKDAAAARLILEDALALEEAGAFCIVLESVTAEAAKMITDRLKIPTLGAGSGPYLDGQSLNLYDILGLSLGVVPRFAKKYLNLVEEVPRVLGEYKKDVEEGKFPAEEHYFRMDEKEIKKLTGKMIRKKRGSGPA
ncbi:MAG: 3-methyl-2-oxobutanoate hydroxymethyltransferase [Deltaproteobacteria bacterium]|nr:3-methyl-2-oxobutanoate hydroxymethyltransferase [Deltaproteobacteria bacterium]